MYSTVSVLLKVKRMICKICAGWVGRGKGNELIVGKKGMNWS